MSNLKDKLTGEELEAIENNIKQRPKKAIYISPITKEREEMEVLGEVGLYYKVRPAGMEGQGIRVLKKYIEII